MMVVLLATGAWFGVSGDRTVDKSTADPGTEVATIETPPSDVAAVSLGVMKSVIWTVEIRNNGGKPVDAADFRVSSDTKLELVRGSFDLPPGDTALIVTHADMSLDDEVRTGYANLYRAVTPDGSAPILGVDSFTLTTGLGLVLGDGGTTSIDKIGRCCYGGGQCAVKNHYVCCTQLAGDDWDPEEDCLPPVCSPPNGCF